MQVYILIGVYIDGSSTILSVWNNLEDAETAQKEMDMNRYWDWEIEGYVVQGE